MHRKDRQYKIIKSLIPPAKSAFQPIIPSKSPHNLALMECEAWNEIKICYENLFFIHCFEILSTAFS